MATPNDDDPLHVGSKPVDEPHEASVQPQGVLRTDSGASDQQEVASGDRGSSSDQQIAENLELPAEFRLIYQPPTVSLQGTHGHGCLTSGLLEHGGCPTGCRVEAVDGEPNYMHSPSLATSSRRHGSKSCSSRIKADGGCSDCFYLIDTCKDGGQVGMNTADGSLTIAHIGELFKKIHVKYVKNEKGDMIEVFALQSSTSNYFLAVDTYSCEVKGITKCDMKDQSNCWWRIQPFNKIGTSIQFGDFALQYWGVGFGSPNPNPAKGYYFIIQIQPPKPTDFKVAEKSKAAVYGRFTYSRP